MLPAILRCFYVSLLALLFQRGAGAEARVQVDPHSSPHQQGFALLVQARLRAIEEAFPQLTDLTDVAIRIAFGQTEPDENFPVSYNAALDTMTFRPEVLGFASDSAIATASDYWEYYEREDLHAEYPIIEMLDDALWTALLEEFAQQNQLAWPPTGCESTELPRRLGCQMLVSGVDFFVHSRRMRIFNENRLDRLWPSDLSELESHGWQRGDREYQEVRELGGIELIKPLVEEFGAPRVFAYVAQTPFVVQGNDLFKSATLYQRRAREVLGW